jgi:hypothetical protein
MRIERIDREHGEGVQLKHILNSEHGTESCRA